MSREDVIRRLVGREQQQLDLTEEVVFQEEPELHASACEHFGTWETALEYAGIELEIPGQKWSPEKVIEALQLRQQQGFRMQSIWEDDNPLAMAALHYFGSMRNARLAAGVEVDDEKNDSTS